MLRIAVPSSGRIKTDTLAMLDKVGVKINKYDELPLLVRSYDFPAEIFFVEKVHVAKSVMEGLADVGVSSEFWVAQNGINSVNIVRRLGFDRATLSLLVPQDAKCDGLRWFNNRVVATPFPDILASFFKANAVKAVIRPMYENVYKAINAGIADAIMDKVYSGTSLLTEHLREVAKVFQSEALMIASPNISTSSRLIVDELLERIDSVIAARNKKYITMYVPVNKLVDVSLLLPSISTKNTPTSRKMEYVNINAVIDDSRLWDIIDKLRSLGVRDIVACPIDNIIP